MSCPAYSIHTQTDMHLRAEALEDGNGLRIGLRNWRRHRCSSTAGMRRKASPALERGPTHEGRARAGPINALAENAEVAHTRRQKNLARRARGMQSSRAGTDKAESGQREIVTVLDHSISAGRTSASDLP